MNYYYCFACKKLFRSENDKCRRCGKGAAKARRELGKTTEKLDIYKIFVGDQLVANQRVQKKSG